MVTVTLRLQLHLRLLVLELDLLRTIAHVGLVMLCAEYCAGRVQRSSRRMLAYALLTRNTRNGGHYYAN